MNRRHFLAALAAGGTAIAVPELWTPSRTFFLPPKGGWLSSFSLWKRSAELKRDMEAAILQGYTRADIRQDLINAIYAVDPYKAPLLFNMARNAGGRVYVPTHEWLMAPEAQS